MNSVEAQRISTPETQISIPPSVIIFMGAEGSGKTVNAKKVSELLGRPYITTGGIIRDMAINDQTEYGDECRAMLKEQRYLDPQMIQDIMLKRFSEEDTKDGFILDGGLRVVEETQNFQSILERANRNMPVTIFFMRVPTWMGMKRLSTNSSARGRDDDHVEAVLSRMGHFYNRLGERASLIRSQPNWKIEHVDATKNPDEVFSVIFTKLTDPTLRS